MGKTVDSSIMNFYAIGTRNIEDLAKLQFIAAYLQQENMNLQVRLKSVGCTDGLSVYSQSTNESPGDMNLAIETFIMAQE